MNLLNLYCKQLIIDDSFIQFPGENFLCNAVYAGNFIEVVGSMLLRETIMKQPKCIYNSSFVNNNAHFI